MLQQFVGLVLSLLMAVKVIACDKSSLNDGTIVATTLAELTPMQRHDVDGLARSADVRTLISSHANQDPFEPNKRFGSLDCRTHEQAISYPIGVWDLSQMFKVWDGNGVPSERLKEILLAARMVVGVEGEGCEWGGAIKEALREADVLPLANETISARSIAHLLAGDIPPPHLNLISSKVAITLCGLEVDVYCGLPFPL